MTSLGRHRITRLAKTIPVVYRRPGEKWSSVELKPGCEVSRDLAFDITRVQAVSNGDALIGFIEFNVGDERHKCGYLVIDDELDECFELAPVQQDFVVIQPVSRGSKP